MGKLTPFDSDALSFQAKNYPYDGLVPYRIVMTKTVYPDFPFMLKFEDKHNFFAKEGFEYPCYVNSYGAVSAIIEFGEKCELLGVKPDEFKVIQWHWHMTPEKGGE